MSMASYYSNWAHHHLALSRSGAYLYAVNHKAACSTVLRTLWSLEAEVGRAAAPPTDQRGLHHAMQERGRGPWRHWTEAAGDAPVRFTVARNPYARIASCYFDKMRRPSPQRRFFMHNAGLDPAEPLAFSTFLEALAGLPRELDDTHWARQSFNTGVRVLPLTHIAKVETLERDLPGILAGILAAIDGSGGALARAAPHATGAGDRLRALFGPRELELANRIYQPDFTLFGYAMNDLDDLAGVPVNPEGMPLRRNAAEVRALVSAAAELKAGRRDAAIARLEPLAGAEETLLRHNAILLMARASPRPRRIALLEGLLEDGAADPIVAKTLAAAIAARGREKRARALLAAAAKKPVSAGYFHRHAAGASALMARL